MALVTAVAKGRSLAWELLHAVCTTKKKKVKSLNTKIDMVKKYVGSSHCGSVEMNLACVHEDAGSIPCLALWVRDIALP